MARIQQKQQKQQQRPNVLNQLLSAIMPKTVRAAPTPAALPPAPQQIQRRETLEIRGTTPQPRRETLEVRDTTPSPISIPLASQQRTPAITDNILNQIFPGMARGTPTPKAGATAQTGEMRHWYNPITGGGVSAREKPRGVGWQEARTVPHDFVGPLQKGIFRMPPPRARARTQPQHQPSPPITPTPTPPIAPTPPLTPTPPITPTPTPPALPPEQPLPIMQRPYEDRMRAILEKYERLLTAPAPVPAGLTPEERQLFAGEKEHLQVRYDAALENLRRQQAEEKQRLIGRYAAMGFTEPGVIAGPMAGEPGIVTKGVLRKREGQRRELADLEQARAGDILAVARAEQEAGRRARAEEVGAFERRQEAVKRNLERLLGLAQPERFSVGGRVFERDLITGEVRDITPPEALRQQVEVERDGRRMRITLDAQGKEIGSIDLGPVKQEQIKQDQIEIERDGRRLRVTYDSQGREIRVIDLGPVKVERAPAKPTSFQEWILAGGKVGTGLSYKDWLAWRRKRPGSLIPGEGAL